MENLANLHSEFCIFGYFNLQLDKHKAVTITFNDILTSFDLKQHVTFSTHIHGHWLDQVITRSTCHNIQMLTVSSGLSDHYYTVIVDVNFSRTLVQSKHNVSYIHYIHRLALMPLRLIFLNPNLSEIQRDTCPTCVNNISCTQGFT